MFGRIRVLQGPDLGRDFPLAEGEISAGRDPEHAICLTDRSASRTHFLLQITAAEVRLIDMGSKNATRVNGEPVHEHVMRDGDVIEVGRTRLQYVAEEPADGAAPPLPGFAAPRLPPDESPLVRAARRLAAAESAVGAADELVALAVACTAASSGVIALLEADGRLTPIAGSGRLREVPARGALAEGRGKSAEAIAAALRGTGGPIGVLQLDGAGFGPEAEALLAGFAGQAGPRLESLRARDRSVGERVQALEALGAEFALEGDSPAMVEVRRRITRAAAADGSVLLVGEAGTGKRRAARSIHHKSRRAGRPFVEHDCRPGAEAPEAAVARAGDGTCFLARIDRLEPPGQVAMVQVLAARAAARVVASSERNLAEEAKAGRFREDLYYRLSDACIAIPPLRDRLEDLPLLARRLGTREIPAGWDERAWPGNVSELRAAVTSAST